MLPELHAPVGGGSAARKIAPAGSHIARCYQIIDLGTRLEKSPLYGEKRQRKVQFLFELSNELEVFEESKGKQPFYVRVMYTLSMHEKASLRRAVEGCIGKKLTDKQAAAFNVFNLIGQPCMISVVHSNKTEAVYANVNSISPLPKGIVCPDQINPSLMFSASAPDMEAFRSLPDFIMDKIKESDEFKAYMDAQLEAYPVPAAKGFEIPKPADIDVDFFGSSNELPWD